MLVSPSLVIANALSIKESPVRLLLALLAAVPCGAIMRRMAIATPALSSSTRARAILAMGLTLAAYFCGLKQLLYPLFTCLATYAICATPLILPPLISRRAIASLCFLLNATVLFTAYALNSSSEYDVSWKTCQAVLCLRLIGFAFDYADVEVDAYSNSNSSSRKLTSHSAGAQSIPRSDSAASTSNSTSPSNCDPSVKNTSTTAKTTATAAKTSPASATTHPRVPLAWAGDLSLPHLPPLDHFLAYAFFPGAFLVGPQFSYKLFSRYIANTLYINESESESAPETPADGTKVQIKSKINAYSARMILDTAPSYALNRFVYGIIYIALSQVAAIYFGSGRVLTSEFLSDSLVKRILIAWLVGKTVLLKYFGVWLVSEAACVYSGIAYNGRNPATLEPLWNGLANVHPWAYETATSLNEIIASFNINTNHWAKLYLFKRLRFLNNKHASAALTLAFLAVWHGYHAGYYVAFSLEFFDMEAERILRTAFTASSVGRALRGSRLGAAAVSLGCWLLTTLALFYSTVAFDLLSWARIRVAFSSLYWVGHIAPLAIIAANAAATAVASSGRKQNSRIKSE